MKRKIPAVGCDEGEGCRLFYCFEVIRGLEDVWMYGWLDGWMAEWVWVKGETEGSDGLMG